MKNDPFKEYFIRAEPDKRDKGYAWQTAIGLQAVDGLKTSKYLIDTAIRNIEEALNVRLDEEANKNTNRGKEGIISLPSSKIKIVVIPTDEEVMIARDAYDICLK